MDVASLFDKYIAPVAALGYATREFVLSRLQDVTEEVDISANMLGMATGQAIKICYAPS